MTNKRRTVTVAELEADNRNPYNPPICGERSRRGGRNLICGLRTVDRHRHRYLELLEEGSRPAA